MKLGYALSSEEHGPRALVSNARRAEEVGFDFLSISDHFHPWTNRQGHSPFAWSVIGGIAATTERIHLGTGVTCPLIRTHPAIIAQAAATAADMMPGRFYLGLGSGENLNEHVLGDAWPRPPVRLEMLEEAVVVIRKLFTGRAVSHRGTHYTVDRARIYTLPDSLPPIMIAAGGRRAARLAARVGDGLIAGEPNPALTSTFRNAAGQDKPAYGMLHVCWAPTRDAAIDTATRWWPNNSLPGSIGLELAVPEQFEQVAELIGTDRITAAVVCGPDADLHLGALQAFRDAGFDHAYVHQVGPDQEGFFNFYASEIMPALHRAG